VSTQRLLQDAIVDQTEELDLPEEVGKADFIKETNVSWGRVDGGEPKGQIRLICPNW